MVVFIIIPIEVLVGTNQQPYYFMICILAICRIFDIYSTKPLPVSFL